MVRPKDHSPESFVPTAGLTEGDTFGRTFGSGGPLAAVMLSG